MRTFRLLLIALVFLLQGAAAMASSVHLCCMDVRCPVADCIAMGCIADHLPPAPVGAVRPVHVAPARAPVMHAEAAAVVSHVEDIWTPPD